MADIQIEPLESDRYQVTVADGGGSTTHEVRARKETVEGLGGAEVPPEQLIHESFQFLLEREPKESILARFEITEIASYFPQYPNEIRKRLTGPV